jgi:23S rRNA pseudouridine2605 synthase
LDLVPPGMRRALVPVGRLDFLTEGLLLLTDDGEFAQHVAHPRYGCVKTYETKVRGRPEEAAIAKLEAGIVLDGKRTSPCRITPRPAPRRAADTSSWWIVELSQGRTRQIRDMFERIGHPVQKLRRTAIGPVTDAGLPVGGLRELTEREVEQLRRSSRGDRPPLRPAKRRVEGDGAVAAKRAASGTATGDRPAKPAKRLAPGKAAAKPAKRLAPGKAAPGKAATGRSAARTAPGRAAEGPSKRPAKRLAPGGGPGDRVPGRGGKAPARRSPARPGRGPR